MTLFSLKRANAPAPPLPEPPPETMHTSEAFHNAVIELIYAGGALVQLLLVPTGEGDGCMACGQPNRDHKRFCPVARHRAAVEALKKAVA